MKIYNSLKREKEDFQPLINNKIGMYVCGPTVYDEPHIGHARSAYIFDCIRRYFVYIGFDVKFVRNVTDVDDKIINKARKESSPGASAEDLMKAALVISKKYLGSYHEYMELLGIASPDSEPKATEYIPKMIKFIELLISRGSAYVSGGDVYFDIKKAKDYGKLSNQRLDKMEIGARIAPGENKRDPLDFALWKKAKDDEPSWPSPWGAGRPGWHIECSVMSSDVLGDEFDIHGGGIDLIYPHHENEVAQSEGAGKKFARYWIHNGLLTINSEKMAKSLGNFITIKDFIKRYKDLDYLKLLFLNTHYRHPVDYTEAKIDDMKAEKERISILMSKLSGLAGEASKGAADPWRKKFRDAMDDDFNMPVALSVIFELVSETNKRLSDTGFAMAAKEAIFEFGSVFGLNFNPDLNINVHDDIKVSDADIMKLIDERNAARKAKNFKRADEIRRSLDELGVILEDAKDKTTWRRKI